MSQSPNDDGHPPDILPQADRSQTGPSKAGVSCGQDASDPVELPVRGFSSSQWDGPGIPSGVTRTPPQGRRLEGRGSARCWPWWLLLALKGRREGPAGACRPTGVVPTCQDPQYRTAAAARKSASLHRDVQKPKDRQQQQQQQGKVPEGRLWLTGMAMSQQPQLFGASSSSTSSPDAAEGCCQELQLLGAELHPVADAIMRAWRRRVTLGKLHLLRKVASAAVRVRDVEGLVRRRHRRPVASCGLPGANARRIGVGADLGNRRWCCLPCYLTLGTGSASLSGVGIHPVTFQNASLAADPPWPPCCEEGLFRALSR
jgi:hypothetical protein